MLQTFHWHSNNDGSFWRELARSAPILAEKGFTSVWLPPAYKGAGGIDDRGYAVYDLFDLGEFDQKGTVRTRYGTRAEFLNAIQSLKQSGLHVYADVVFNHRLGGDALEEVQIVEISRENRNQQVSDPHPIRTWSHFYFPGRNKEYSSFEFHWQHFTAFDSCESPGEREVIYKVHDKGFSGEVDFELGNFDFLMGADVDLHHPDVRDELIAWGKWFVDTTSVDGFRLDALKHVPFSFFKDWLLTLRTHFGNAELFTVGEYWSPDVNLLRQYLENTEGVMTLFDVPLHFRFVQASKANNDFDLTTIFDATLVTEMPAIAVTFVDNHDTQPGGGLESWVEPWFKPLAYAMILLREVGYPCVFAADYFGADTPDGKLDSHQMLIDRMLEARRKYGYGEEVDYFDHPNCIAWVRTGDEEHPGAMVVILSNGDAGTKRINTGRTNASYKDVTGHILDEIRTDENGEADFSCPGRSVSVWVQQ